MPGIIGAGIVQRVAGGGGTPSKLLEIVNAPSTGWNAASDQRFGIAGNSNLFRSAGTAWSMQVECDVTSWPGGTNWLALIGYGGNGMGFLNLGANLEAHHSGGGTLASVATATVGTGVMALTMTVDASNNVSIYKDNTLLAGPTASGIGQIPTSSPAPAGIYIAGEDDAANAMLSSNVDITSIRIWGSQADTPANLALIDPDFYARITIPT